MLSVIVPLYNEEEGLDNFLEELLAILAPLEFEVVLVDDGSRDRTWGKIEAWATRDRRIRGLQLSRNFGQQAALLAGLHAADGDHFLMLDGDGQHPPALIPELVAKSREGFEIVHTCREEDRDLPWLKRVTSRWFYKVFSWFSDVSIPYNAADFRLVSRRVRDVIISLEERDLFLRGMFSWTGYAQTWLPYRMRARLRGTTKYSLAKMAYLALSGLTAYSTVPMRLASVAFSGLALLVAVAYSLYAVWVRLVLDQAVPGWASLLILNSFFFSGLFILTGMVGEYVAKIHIEVKRRPQYLVSRETRSGNTETADTR